jgi:hypothetical protein
VGRPLVVLALVAAALACAAAARADTGILAIGDFGVGGDTEREMGAAMRRFSASRPARALVTLGDNDYTASPTAFHRNWTESFGWAARRGLVIAGTLGNHDIEVQQARNEYDELQMPRHRFRKRVGRVAVFALDSNRVGDGQTRWLRSALRSSTAPWKVVAFHHPPYTCGGHSGSEAVASRWVPLFERFDVDLVLAGHDHNYQRFAKRRGVTYVVHGGGGQGLYPIRPCPSSYPRRVVAKSIHGWMYLRASATALRVRAVGPSGRIRDAFTLYP